MKLVKKVYASGGGNRAYTRAAAKQYQGQYGGTMKNATSFVQSNIRGKTGGGAGRPASRSRLLARAVRGRNG